MKSSIGHAIMMALGLVAVFILCGGVHLLPRPDNPCKMSYMWPGYRAVALNLPHNYTLYRYKSNKHLQPDPEALPILFVPGHSGR